MIVDMISDLHGHYPKLEGGDLLIVAGDLTSRDQPIQYGKFAAWIDRQNYTKKVLIAGNHDNFFEKEGFKEIQDAYKALNVDYLCDSGMEFTYYPPLHPSKECEVLERKTYKIWGSPYTAQFPGINPHCCAFTVNYGCDTDDWLDEHWQQIPDDTDILITHGPSYGLHDTNIYGDNCGSKSLTKWIANHVNSLKLFICGHIHEDYGVYNPWPAQDELNSPRSPIHVNCSHVNERYQPVNKPVRIIL